MAQSGEIIAPIGNYITICKRKNKNLETTKLVGVTVEKEIIYKDCSGKQRLEDCLIVEKGDFVTCLMRVGRDKRLPIGLYSDSELSIVSSSYYVFRVNNSDLHSEYLMIYFKNSTMDKKSVFWSDKGIRGTLSWDNFIKLPIVVPALEEQKKIVYKYQTIEKLIQNKRKINELLEKWMKAHYHILFDNLEEFTSEILGNLFQVLKGSQSPKSNFYLEKLYFYKQGGIPFLRTKDIFECKFLNSTSEQLTEAGFKRCKAKLIPENGLIFVGTAGRQGGRLLINQLKTLIISPNLWVIEGVANTICLFLIFTFWLGKMSQN